LNNHNNSFFNPSNPNPPNQPIDANNPNNPANNNNSVTFLLTRSHPTTVSPDPSLSIEYNELQVMSAFPLNEWTNITCCVDRKGIMRIYINGILRGTKQMKYSIRRGKREINRIGNKSNDARMNEKDQNMRGCLSMVKIYNDTCLESETIYQQYIQWRKQMIP
jgi:hypothetical protein